MSRGRVTAARSPRVRSGDARENDTRGQRENHLPKRRALFTNRRARALDTPDGANAVGIRDSDTPIPTTAEQAAREREPEFWEQPTPLQSPRAAKPKE